jgi:hypothetical protein
MMLNSPIIRKLAENKEVNGYQSPSGRITYNKIADQKSFGVFSDIIPTIVPLDIVNDPEQNHKLPSIAKVLKSKSKSVIIHKKYLFLNMTMEEYMDYEDEEDQENMTALLEYVSTFPLKTAVAGIAVQKSEVMGAAHGIAFIVWKINSKRYKFAYYDPLAYKRKTKSYDYTDRAFVSDRFVETIDFINLNEYCFKESKGGKKEGGDFHCSQYIINAEYCYIYSVFFLYLWIENGHQLHRVSFRKAIKGTYVVDPVKLTRTNTKESMIYRLTMMCFVCSTFLTFLKGLTKTNKKYILGSEDNIKRIKTYLADFKTTYGFPLVNV